MAGSMPSSAIGDALEHIWLRVLERILWSQLESDSEVYMGGYSEVNLGLIELVSLERTVTQPPDVASSRAGFVYETVFMSVRETRPYSIVGSKLKGELRNILGSGFGRILGGGLVSSFRAY
jgi:hypothetical protein